MGKSIETIWKEGFLKDDTIVIPKINDLYNQKSKHTVDKLMRMGKNNLIVISIGALAFFIVGIFTGVPIIGALMALSLFYLVYQGKKLSQRWETTDKGTTSFEYLKKVQQWREEVMKGFTRTYRIFYPVFIMLFYIGMCQSNYGQENIQKIVSKYPDLDLWFNMPVIGTVTALTIALLMGLFAKSLYLLDIQMVYGNILNKIDDLVGDMERLNSTNS